MTATSTHPVGERLREPGPKRLLALDGGGIRGLVTLGYLAKIESVLRQRSGRPELVLSDYFDLIGGTSTGSIIATLLSLGWSVERILGLYHEVGRKAFTPKKSWLGAVGRSLGAKFDDRPLTKLLRQHLGDRTLGTEDLRTGLLIVVKRADTGSVWALFNAPDQPFYGANRDMALWQAIRASTAAPTYFRPETVAGIAGGEAAVFVDGGVSMHCNPALQLLMTATLAGFGVRWPWGEDRLLLCSVGTGSFARHPPREQLERFNNLQWAGVLISQLMADAGELNETVLQWISTSPTARRLDAQIGDLQDDLLTPAPRLTYLRYDVELDRSKLAELGLEYSAAEVLELHEMSNTERIADLDRIGRVAAAAQVDAAHFAAAFDRAVSDPAAIR